MVGFKFPFPVGRQQQQGEMLAKRFCNLCLKHGSKNINKQPESFYHAGKLTNAEARKKRKTIFEEEKNKQSSFIKRLEKVYVEYNGYQDAKDEVELLMNKHVSTPYNCAMHISEFLMKRSIVAKVNGEPWDMHRPLIEDCEIEFKHMLDEDPSLSNFAFWRTGSFVLGYILDTAFKDNVSVELCDYPRTKVDHGCFLYDVKIDIPDWKPTQMELNCLSRVGGGIWTKDWNFEPLDVSGDVALRMFEDNENKTKLLKQLLDGSENDTIRVYRMGDYVDFMKGPLINNTSQIHRFSVTAVHQVENDMFGKVYRVQAIALPIDLKLHWWVWEFLCQRAAKPNKIPIKYKKAGTSNTDTEIPEFGEHSHHSQQARV